jgi:DNA-binding GntR family transcriptional regulator
MPLTDEISQRGSNSALTPIERGRTTADEVERRLILAIATGDKAAGERVTEAEIALALNVSRVPAREAMKNLALRGILVGGEHRGLRVSDYGPDRLAELYELRVAIEKIIFQHVMRTGHDREPLLQELAEILERMRDLTGSGDAVALSSVDLDFHRAIARHSGNVLAAQIWEGLAQHVLIICCRDWTNAADRIGEVQLHERLADFIRAGNIDTLDDVLRNHFVAPRARNGG